MNQLTIPNVAVPAHLRNRGTRVALTENIAGGLTTGSSFPKISIKASRFRIVKDGTETPLPVLSLPTVIVGGNPRVSKAFYAEEYDGNTEAKAPDCSSLDGVRPNPDAKSPQAALCATCPKNAWGSKIGKQGQNLKACSDKKRLAVAAADDPSGDFYLLEVTPAAFKDFATYIKNLQMKGIALETVITNVSFDATASFPKLTFGFGGFLSEEAQEAIDARLDDPIIQEITGEAVVHTAQATPAQSYTMTTPAAKPTLVHAAPVEVVEPEIVEAPPAPAVKGFGMGGATAVKAAAPAAPAATAFGGAPATKAAAPKAAPKKAAPPVDEPAAVKSTDLANEIASLLGSMDADD